MFRFLHSSDLHLGKPFGAFPEDPRGRLRRARQSAVARLAQAARDGGARLIMLAGDSFDAETPSPSTIRHALQAMAEAPDLTWVMLPGNHDSLAAADLWRRVAHEAPANLRLALDTSPIPVAEGALVLPAPCTARRPGRDLTEGLMQPSPDGVLRIGLAHGAIRDFSEEGTAAPIPPDRAETAGLDYLALGDWHGQMRITARTWYSGTPEADSFKHQSGASALLVTLAGPGVPPEITAVPTGKIAWTDLAPDMLPGDDPAALLDSLLPPAPTRRDTLLRLRPQGRLGLAARTALERAAAQAAPDFCWFEADLSSLAIDPETDDLDLIDSAGALRVAADALWAEAKDPDLSAEDRAIAAAALARLFTFAADAQ